MSFFPVFLFCFSSTQKYLKLSRSKIFKKLAFQGIPLYSKSIFRTLNYVVINVFKKHKISVIHYFFFPALPFVLQAPENT